MNSFRNIYIEGNKSISFLCDMICKTLNIKTLIRGFLILLVSVLFILLPIFSDIKSQEKNNVFAFSNIDQAMEQSNDENIDKPFSIIWFTDTQYYASEYPEIYDFLGNWLVNEYHKGTFEYAINTGDIVDSASNINQWEVASNSFKKLDDADVPYGVVAGNHDVTINGIDYSMFSKYFGKSRYKHKPWYGGSVCGNQNHYDLLSFGCHDFIIIYLGYDSKITDKTIKWSNKILKKYSNRTAIVAMHEYLGHDATLSLVAQNVFDNIIMENDNVVLVLCGHNYGAVRNIKTIINTDGSTRNVLELLSNYQKGESGGAGFLRYLNFDPAKGTLNVVTYSPYINKYNFFEANEDSFTEKIQLK